MRQIAEVAGVTHSTVSLALRRHHSIPVETQKRIKALARKMGYRPDPMLSSLNIYRQRKLGAGYQATLVWLNGFKQKDILRSNPDFNLYWKGAVSQAAQDGYKVEEIWVHESGMTFGRLAKILKSRQVQGILLPPMPSAHTKFELPWDQFSVVAFGYSHEPLFHLVTHAQYRGARLLVRKLHQLGYRSIGMLTWPDMEERTDYNYSSGYLCECRRLGMRPFFCEEENPPDGGGVRENSVFKQWADVMNRWVRREKPDVILMPDPVITTGMLGMGLNLPPSTALAVYSYYRSHSKFAGIYQNPEDIGATAASQLISMIQRNERGKPVTPLRVLVDGKWVSGSSAPRVK